MAGKSPDRVEKQESSGESAGRAVVDPRLTVFRGPAAPGPDGGSGQTDADTSPDTPDVVEPVDAERTGDTPKGPPEPAGAGTADAPESVRPVVDTVEDEAEPDDAPPSAGAGSDVPSEGPVTAPERAEALDELQDAPERAEVPLRAPAHPEAVTDIGPAVAVSGSDTSPGKRAGPSDADVTPDDGGAESPAVVVESSSGSGKTALRPPAVAAPDDEIGTPRASDTSPDNAAVAAAVAAAPPKLPVPPPGPVSPKASVPPPGPVPALSAGQGDPPPREYTRQMPIPPEPAQPLKLLAELTNTPPPVETKTRNAVRRVKIWTPLVLLLLIVFAVAQSVRPSALPELSLTAAPSYSFEGKEPTMPWPGEGQAAVMVEGLGDLGTFGEQKPVPIASVTKTMTAYILLRDHPIKKGTDGAVIPVDKTAEEQYETGLAGNESVVKVAEKQKLTQREALEAIMIASANNVARLVARWDAGSEEAFIKKMNEAAEELGMSDTTYTDPSGLKATTVSTAVDQVKLGRAVMEDQTFREVVALPEYTDSNGTRQPNWNHLVPYNGAVGIKTGTTTAAGGNLLFAAKKEIGGTTQLIIGAVVNQPPDPVNNSILAGAVNASRELILGVQDELRAETVVRKGEVVGYVDDGYGNHTPVVVTKDVSAVGWAGLKVGIAVKADDGLIPREAAAGTTVGTLTVGSGPGQVKVPVALQKDLTAPSFGDKLLRVA